MSENNQERIDSLNQKVVQLYQEGQYAQALPMAIQACDLARHKLEAQHPDVAQSLNNLAILYDAMGNYAAAEPLYCQALDILRQALGEAHPDVARSLNNLAELYRAIGNYATAEPLYKQALDIRRQTLGEDHPDVARSLNNLAGLYRAQIDELNQQVVQLYQEGQYAQALPMAIQACDLARHKLGAQHPAVAQSLNNLAVLYQAMGHYAQAEPLYCQALDIRREAVGEHHPTVAQSLNNLAELYRAMGHYAAAEPLYKQALDILHQAVDEHHPTVAQSLNNLAELYRAMGHYAAAEPLYKQALDILHQAVGEHHPDYATSLDNLALLYQAMGHYAAAEPKHKQALDILRQVLGEDHPDYATSLHNLALLYRAMGHYAAAEPLYKQALAIARRTLGAVHPDVATGLDNLALLYRAMGHYVAAEPLHKQALDILRQALGEDHPDYATSLHNLALLYGAMGHYTQAEPLYRQASDIRRRALGAVHPDVATGLNNLAALYVATNRAVEAMALMQEAAAIDDRMIGQLFSIGSESQRLEYLMTLQGNLHAFLSLVLQHLSHASEAVQAALQLVLRRKALGAEALAVQRDAVLGGRYPTLQPQLQELMTWRRQIALKTLAGPGPEGPEAHQRLLVEWTAHKERLEGELVHQIPEMNLEQQLRAVDLRTVAQALPEGSALVEFVRCDICDFKAVPARGELLWQPAHYLAFVLSAGEPDNMHLIDLGEAEPTEQLIHTFRRAITGEGERGEHEVQVSGAAVPAEEPGAAAGRGEAALRFGRPAASSSGDSAETGVGTAVRAALFDPLVPALAGCRRLFLAPDGDLTRLPFAVLPSVTGRLVDDYHFSYLGVGRDVLRFGAETSGQPAKSLVAADPDFDLGSEGAPALASNTKSPGLQSRALGRQSRALDPNALHFDPLPGTHVEGEHIAARLGVPLWLKGAALEGRLKTSPSPRILHIATHGFFLEDQERDPNQVHLGLGALGGSAESRLGRLSHALESPLLRSGLALAGANTWLGGKPLPPEAEDGFLTAEDVSGLDLIGTELVVLSACETGLGAVQVGEGVFGLRRAFMLAGAKTLVMSLWKVPDQQTQALMEDFYRRILAGQPRSAALREAQLAMKAQYPEPLYWGAFICQGDPGPLRQI